MGRRSGGAYVVRHHSHGRRPTNVIGTGILPLPVAGAVAQWDAQQITGQADNTALGTWTDGTGHGHSLTQATGANKPTYFKTTSAGLINGHPAVTFTAANFSSMSNSDAAVIMTQPFTFFVVAKWAAVGSVACVYSSNTNGVLMENNPGSFIFAANGGIVLGTADTSLHALMAVCNGASSQGQLDGTNTGTVNPGTTNMATSLVVGRNGLGSAAFGGIIGEIAIWNSALTGANLTSLRTYAQSKWGTP